LVDVSGWDIIADEWIALGHRMVTPGALKRSIGFKAMRVLIPKLTLCGVLTIVASFRLLAPRILQGVGSDA
jgi:hypothetical protein